MRIIFSLVISFLLISCSNNKGRQIPNFTATTIAGKTITPADLKGKIVVLKIWATWCGDCSKEISTLNRLVKKYENDSSVVFLAITDDSKEKIERFLQQRPFYYQHITDSKELKLEFQRGLIKEIPEHIVIDIDGEIVADVSGSTLDIYSFLETTIEELKK